MRKPVTLWNNYGTKPKIYDNQQNDLFVFFSLDTLIHENPILHIEAGLRSWGQFLDVCEGPRRCHVQGVELMGS
jgi:hypothetical protein